ncbi:hypothetical protein ElyMa_006819700 [Elysia marginata]|uniref:Uncharacterized protein n=1 Tax=Elysia marginata TaxID=1093978 RepID=A0AAV4J7N4_9GAST|nr:hypothetical protein ElyMa_006819700 [Elysia marginata]
MLTVDSCVGAGSDPARLAPKLVPKRTVDTQTDQPPKSPEPVKKTFGNRCIQTEYPERYDNLGFGFSRGHSSSGSQETRGTETDVINTVEKAVNTPTRSLQSLTSQLERARMTTHSGEEASPTPGAEATPPSTSTSTTTSAGSGEQQTTATETASQRRHRRRRERARALEVSVRPTTLTSGYGGRAGSSDGYAGDGDCDLDSTRGDGNRGDEDGGGGDGGDEDGGGGDGAVVVVSAECVSFVNDVDVNNAEEEVGSGSRCLLPVLTYSSSIEESVFVAEAETPTATVNFIAPGFEISEETGEGGERHYYVPFTGGASRSSEIDNVSDNHVDNDDDDGDHTEVSAASVESGDELSVTAVINRVNVAGPTSDCVDTFSDTERSTVATVCTGLATYSTVATNTRSVGKTNASTSPPRF